MSEPASERLIEGTMRSIAKHGLGGLTVTNIVAESGLTRGMVTKSFRKKEHLLQATAARYGEVYFARTSAYLARAGKDPKVRVRAAVQADLSKEVLNRETIAVWAVLRSLGHSDPKIRKYSTTRDSRLQRSYADLIAASLGQSGKDCALAQDLATATIAMLEGLWSDYFLYPRKFDRKKAENLVMMLLEPYWQ